MRHLPLDLFLALRMILGREAASLESLPPLTVMHALGEAHRILLSRVCLRLLPLVHLLVPSHRAALVAEGRWALALLPWHRAIGAVP